MTNLVFDAMPRESQSVATACKGALRFISFCCCAVLPLMHLGCPEPTTPEEEGEVDYHTLSISVRPSGSGSVSADPPGGTYREDTNVLISATPSTGWVFDHWEDDASGSLNPVAVTMRRDRDVTAVFVQVAVGEGEGKGEGE